MTRSTYQSSRSWTCLDLCQVQTKNTRNHQPRRKAPVRLLRGDSSASDGHYAESLRRCVRRDGVEALGADVNYAWPTAEIAVMGPQGAVNVLYDDELEDADDVEARRQQLIDEYRDAFANPYTAAKRGFVDDVIERQETRPRLMRLDLSGGNARTSPTAARNVPL